MGPELPGVGASGPGPTGHRPKGCREGAEEMLGTEVSRPSREISSRWEQIQRYGVQPKGVPRILWLPQVPAGSSDQPLAHSVPKWNVTRTVALGQSHCQKKSWPQRGSHGRQGPI